MKENFVTLGTYEDSRGFERDAQVVPYWPGGLRSWTAPLDGFQDPGPPIIVQEVIAGNKFGTVQMLITIGVVAVLLFLAGLWVWKYRTLKLDAEEESMRQSTDELREMLQMTKEHGYVLSTEANVAWGRRSPYVIIPKLQMEAAVRLMRLEDFDVDAFDALCVLVADNEYHAQGRGAGAGGGGGGGREAPMQAHASVELSLFPSLAHVEVEAEAQAARNADASYAHAYRAADAHQEAAARDRMLTWDLRGHGVTHAASARVPSGGGDTAARCCGTRQLAALRWWLLQHTSAILAELSIGQLPAAYKKHQMSEAHLYRYFCCKILRVRIFRDNSCQLFHQLKEHVQVFMNQLAGKCNERVRQLASEPGGPALRSFSFAPDQGTIVPEASVTASSPGAAGPASLPIYMVTDKHTDTHGDSHGASASECQSQFPPVPEPVSATSPRATPPRLSLRRHGPAPIRRQDDARVGAVKTHPEDLLERARESGTNALDCSEAVYIAQLHRRAVVLNSTFTAKVMDALSVGGNALPQRSARESHEDNVSMSQEESTKSITGLIPVEFVRQGQLIEVHVCKAPVKTQERMRDKLTQYVPPYPQSQWPLTAFIADPVRLSIVCSGPAHIMETVRWFLDTQHQSGLQVCRIKNAFALPDDEVPDGYRDVSINVLFVDGDGLKIIGEIQVHDRSLYEFKNKMHKLYSVKRSHHPSSLYESVKWNHRVGVS